MRVHPYTVTLAKLAQIWDGRITCLSNSLTMIKFIRAQVGSVLALWRGCDGQWVHVLGDLVGGLAIGAEA